MAFTGVAVVKQVADNLMRITGVSLAAEGATGTIALFEKLAPAPDIRLPAGFKPRAYDYPDGAPDVSLQDSVQVSIIYTNGGAVYEAISVVKTGTNPEDFLITLTNNAAVEGGDSGALEIYVRFH
jgi:hypothetical protein